MMMMMMMITMMMILRHFTRIISRLRDHLDGEDAVAPARVSIHDDIDDNDDDDDDVDDDDDSFRHSYPNHQPAETPSRW
jgi:hypothetical protein